MIELTLRDGMVIVGSLLIVAVIIDALRRMRQQSRDRVRMKLATDVGEDELLDDISSFRELPNGGARVISRDELLSRSRGEREETPDVDAVADAEPDVTPHAAAAQTPAAERPEPVEPEPAYAEAQTDVLEDDAAALTGVRAGIDEPANLDWLEDLPEHEGAATDDAGELPRHPETDVIILHVVSRSEQGFSGADILEILLACDLRFGDMDFFHRHEHEAGRGAIQFSVANMLQPGVFDIDNMDTMLTRGLVFFVTLPGPENMLQAFDYMLETARAVARNLDGDLLDESRSVLTQQSVEHARQQIRELERRLLARGG